MEQVLHVGLVRSGLCWGLDVTWAIGLYIFELQFPYSKTMGLGDGGMASQTQWTRVWVNSRSWWWTVRPGVLQSMGLQSQTQLSNWTELMQLGPSFQGSSASWLICSSPSHLRNVPFSSPSPCQPCLCDSHCGKDPTSHMHPGHSSSDQGWANGLLPRGMRDWK